MFKCDGFNGTIVLSMWPFHIGGSVKNFLKAVAWPPVVLKLNVTTASRFWGGGMGYWVAALSVWNASSTHHRSKPNLHHLGEDHLAAWRRREWCTSCPPLHRVTPHSFIRGWKPISSKSTSRYHIIISLHLFRCLRCDRDKRENPSSHLLFTSFLLTTYFHQFFSHHLFLESSTSDNNFLQSEAEKVKV